MTSDTSELKKVNLGIGEIIVSREPIEITTVLGSCVSLCLFDEQRGIAGMNHYMLPKPGEGRGGDIGRFGSSSIPELLKRMRLQGANLAQLTAKVFGGAQMLSQFSNFSRISENNVEMAKQLLAENKIKIVASDVGGNRGRKVIFRTDNGRVLVRQVGKRDSL